MIRTFIAIRLPDPILEALGTLAGDLARNWPAWSVRWVRAEGIHLTLRFLGNTDADLLPALKSGLDEAIADFAPFELRLDDMDCFPNPHRPRVLWVGVRDEEDRLASLQKAVELMVQKCGWEREDKVFKPHLTLGRMKDRQRPPQGEWLLRPPDLAFEVGAIELIESRLKPTGAEYVTLHQAPLTAG